MDTYGLLGGGTAVGQGSEDGRGVEQPVLADLYGRYAARACPLDEGALRNRVGEERGHLARPAQVLVSMVRLSLVRRCRQVLMSTRWVGCDAKVLGFNPREHAALREPEVALSCRVKVSAGHLEVNRLAFDQDRASAHRHGRDPRRSRAGEGVEEAVSPERERSDELRH